MNLEKLAKEIAPDYSFTDNFGDGEYLWAIQCAYKGTEQANGSAHRFIKHLGKELGLTDEQIYQKWVEFEGLSKV